ncbi:MAG: transposase [Candidatus Vogelbacteria bacterium]|nr:transposase [Candidatus Vogelbacteria bacterium]
MRKVEFANNEFYHLYNRGVDKRNIFGEKKDVDRFLQSLKEFNTIEPIGSIFEQSFSKTISQSEKKLVEFVCYALNHNHYHLLVRQVSDQGIEKFMHRLSTGYTRYFNDRNQRTGSLFQGPYQARYVDSNEYLLHLSVYINLNDIAHGVNQLGGLASKLGRTSWGEFTLPTTRPALCQKDIILGQFGNIQEYKDFAKEALVGIQEQKLLAKELEGLELGG